MMVTDALFIHSAGAQAGGHGSAPLVHQLRDDLGPGFRLRSPTMPAPTRPTYERWKQELESLLVPPGQEHRPPQLLIGHSLGGSVLLKLLSERKRVLSAVTGLFIIGAPFWGNRDWTVDEFVLREDFAKTLPETLRIFLYQSRDDEVVGIEHLARYAEALPQATVRRLHSGGHTFKNGLPELVADMRALVRLK